MTGETNINPASLFRIVDSVAETNAMGVALVENGTRRLLRQPSSQSSSYVGFQIRTRDSMANPAFDAARIEHNRRFWTELQGMGVSCAGAIVGAVGVVATVSVAPETGGLTIPAAVVLWGSAATSGVQCAVSLYKFGNILVGRDAANDDLDKVPGFTTAMYVMDGIGLVTAGGAIRDAAIANNVLKEAGLTWTIARSGSLNRAQRLALTEGLEIQGAKRLAASTIHKVVKKKLLDLTGAAIGVSGSASTDGGILHDTTIWIIKHPER